MHGLHQGTEKVHTGMTDSIVLPLQRSHNLTAHHFPEANGGRGGEGGEGREGGKEGGRNGVASS